jgi:hypothetical protein
MFHQYNVPSRPARVIAFMFVLTGIRVDLVRFGRGEFDDNMPAFAKILREDLRCGQSMSPRLGC